MKILENIFLLLAFFVCYGLSGQDMVYLKNGEEIAAKIKLVESKSITYVKYGYEDGPSFKISKKDIIMIRYENGSTEIINEAANGQFNSKRNSVAVNYGDLFVSRMAIGFQHNFKGGKVGVRVPFSLSYQDRSTMYDEVLWQTGVDLNYYPLGQKKLTYYTGISARFGQISNQLYGYWDPYYNEFIAGDLVEREFYGGYVNNGLVLHFTDYFAIDGFVGIGVRKIQNRLNPEPFAIGGLSAMIKF